MKKIAIPVENGLLCAHFGHASSFEVFEAKEQKIENEHSIIPPPHAPGVIPKWLSEHGVTDVIAGGMGQRAIKIFNDHGINVYTGAEAKGPKELAVDLLENKLIAGQNLCDH